MIEAFNFRVILEYLPLYLSGLWNTVWISGASLVLALAFAIAACVARLSGVRWVSLLASFYIESIRSTPLLAQLYFLYFGLPTLGLQVSEWQTGILALSLNCGAYMAEIIRAGVMSVSKGQIEAAIASGLTFVQRLKLIILPQAIGVTIPPLLGQMIVLVKDSSLLSLISVLELTRAGQLLASDRIMPMEGFLMTALLYWLIYICLKALSTFSQKRLIHHSR
jgi:polar amino acid transport system permease protein